MVRRYSNAVDGKFPKVLSSDSLIYTVAGCHVTKPRIVADAAIPFLEELIGDQAHLIRHPGHTLTHAQLQHADALLVRTVTQVNGALLNDTPVRFIGSATAGVDHICLDDVHHPPRVVNASGANATAVAEYVLCVLARLQLTGMLPHDHLRIGIIGVGEVGQRVQQHLTTLGATLLLSDPPRAARSPNFEHQALDQWHNLDLITLHTPLTTQGPDATYHLLSEDVLRRQKPGCLVLNTSRGEVFDSASLHTNPQRRYCFDVWEHEPNVALDCVQRATLATPHIAGYTREAKYRASQRVVQALHEFFGWAPRDVSALLASYLPPLTLTLDHARTWQDVVTAVFDPRATSEAFKHAMSEAGPAIGQVFEELRRQYPLRREFSAYHVHAPELTAVQRTLCNALGFADVTVA